MRLKFIFSKNTEELPKNRSILNSYVHKCLGINNKYHDSKNNYSISHLRKMNNTIYFVVSSLDNEFITKMISGVMNNKNFGYGMTLIDIVPIEEKFFDGVNHFTTISPILIKRYSDKKNYMFETVDNPDFSKILENYLIRKLRKIDITLQLSDFKVEIKPHESHTVRKVMVKNVKNLANRCQIDIHTNKKVAELLYNIGIGQSTGSGFGAICKTENLKLYY